MINRILKNPTNYPGKHLTPAPRTTAALKPLEPLAQALIIWRAMIEYVQEKLANGKSVNLRSFGVFSFDINTDLPKIATKMINTSHTIEEQRLERKHVHKVRPVFIVDQRLKSALARYPGKEEIDKPKSQASVYQKGFSTIFCNPVPIAAACFLGKEVVESTMNAIFTAVADLTKQGRDLELRFGFANIRILNRDLKVVFKPGFVGQMNQKEFEGKMRQSDMQTSQHWRQTYTQKWAQSSLSKLMQRRPHSPLVKTLAEKTQALKLMSLDMASSGVLVPKAATFKQVNEENPPPAHGS